MELRLKNGDYIPDGHGGVLRAAAEDALLQRVLFRLTAHRGMFPLLPELGSDLYLLGREKPSARLAAARQAVAAAVSPEGLTVREVILRDRADGGIDVTAWLEDAGQLLPVTVTV